MRKASFRAFGWLCSLPGRRFHDVEGAPLIALTASFFWGILSIVLSPCHLASITLIVGFISKQSQVTAKRAFWTSTLFAVGILITIAVIGAVTAGAGRMMGDVGRYGNYFVALVFFVVGLHLLGVMPMPFSGAGQVGLKRKGFLAAFILGLVFGIALGPCTFAYMAPMLGRGLESTAQPKPVQREKPLQDRGGGTGGACGCDRSCGRTGIPSTTTGFDHEIERAGRRLSSPSSRRPAVQCPATRAFLGF